MTTALGSDQDIATVRRHIGSGTPPTDDDVYEAILEAGTPELAAQWYLETLYADILSNPAQMSVTGYSENWAANISKLAAKIEELQLITGTGSQSIEIITLKRAGRNGR